MRKKKYRRHYNEMPKARQKKSLLDNLMLASDTLNFIKNDILEVMSCKPLRTDSEINKYY